MYAIRSYYVLTDQVDVNQIIQQSMEYYEEQKSTLHISVTIETEVHLTVHGNSMLTEILIQNLLKNAFLHNTENGILTIYVCEKQLAISNSGHNRNNFV